MTSMFIESRRSASGGRKPGRACFDELAQGSVERHGFADGEISEAVVVALDDEPDAWLVGERVEGNDLVLIKRTRPGQEPCLVTIGGGIEPEDASVEDALRREIAEEVGGAGDAVTDQLDGGVGVQRLFIARLVAMDLAMRTGTEFAKPERGGYEVVRVPFVADALATLDAPLMPPAIRSFVLANVDALRDVLNEPVDRQ